MLRNNQLGIRVRISMELCGIVLDCSLHWPPNMCLLPLPHPLLRSPRLSLSLPHHPSLRARADFEHIDLNTQWNSLGSPRISRYNNLHWPNSQHYLSFFLTFFFSSPQINCYTVCVTKGGESKGSKMVNLPTWICSAERVREAVLFALSETTQRRPISRMQLSTMQCWESISAVPIPPPPPNSNGCICNVRCPRSLQADTSILRPSRLERSGYCWRPSSFQARSVTLFGLIGYFVEVGHIFSEQSTQPSTRIT